MIRSQEVLDQAEVAAYVDAHTGEVDERGRRLVVGNGHHTPRKVLTGAGAVEVVAPRVNDKRLDEVTGERRRFSSAILPPWCRRSPKVSEVLPLLHLHGLSGNDFGPALEQFLGTSAGLSATTVTRLTATGRTRARRSPAATCRTWTRSTCGPTACTSTSAWTRNDCVCSS
jgi:hypothetical protein